MISLNNNLFEKIQSCIDCGYNVMILLEEVYIYTTFEASTSSNVSSIDFCQATVVCITDFMKNTQIVELTNKNNFKNKLSDKIDSLGKPIILKFQKNMEYLLFCRF